MIMESSPQFKKLAEKIYHFKIRYKRDIKGYEKGYPPIKLSIREKITWFFNNLTISEELSRSTHETHMCELQTKLAEMCLIVIEQDKIIQKLLKRRENYTFNLYKELESIEECKDEQ